MSFDTTPLFACREVTNEEFSRSFPEEKLVQVQWSVSSLVQRGREDDLVEWIVSLEMDGQSLRVVAYAPQTTMSSQYASNVSIERKRERSQGAGVAIAGPVDWPIKVTGSGDAGTKNADVVRYELVAPQTTAAASGTIRGGTGVYFKLRASRSDTLEGSKEFSVTFAVPRGWRAGVGRLSCSALGIQRGVLPPTKQQVDCGTRRFLVALYAEGDAKAKATAEQLLRAQTQLARAVSDNRREIEQQAYPNVLHRIGALLDLVPPRLPDGWTTRLTSGAATELEPVMVRRLPLPVREAITEYDVARQALSGLSRGGAAELQQLQ